MKWPLTIILQTCFICNTSNFQKIINLADSLKQLINSNERFFFFLDKCWLNVQNSIRLVFKFKLALKLYHTKLVPTSSEKCVAEWTKTVYKQNRRSSNVLKVCLRTSWMGFDVFVLNDYDPAHICFGNYPVLQ